MLRDLLQTRDGRPLDFSLKRILQTFVLLSVWLFVLTTAFPGCRDFVLPRKRFAVEEGVRIESIEIVEGRGTLKRLGDREFEFRSGLKWSTRGLIQLVLEDGRKVHGEIFGSSGLLGEPTVVRGEAGTFWSLDGASGGAPSVIRVQFVPTPDRVVLKVKGDPARIGVEAEELPDEGLVGLDFRVVGRADEETPQLIVLDTGRKRVLIRSYAGLYFCVEPEGWSHANPMKVKSLQFYSSEVLPLSIETVTPNRMLVYDGELKVAEIEVDRVAPGRDIPLAISVCRTADLLSQFGN